ncbi:MAG: glycosyltransferase [Candidatus Aenigmarchaeota archaeon]|nr:glycosyltransferase [Candidatus Aenigmarchaeota archaeon]NIP40364.1 glycosyltransferase [Candidatus Aenigmarchaeota archaeon]NIQ18290.1 glycosyltransferase [Candidatus Aenigmarchaeota archaeon]NIS73242.1 glycosyltransferase [Candidatus Aenigmarchaeota archaeon]
MKSFNNEKNRPLTLFLSSYPPRKCGISTFTQDLSTAIDGLKDSELKSKFIAINDNGNYQYPDDVMFQINENEVQDYVKTAEEINGMTNVRQVSIQHEFKLYGSEHGENLLSFLETLEKPAVTTFHAVLSYPSEKRKRIVRAIAEKSANVIVMSNKAVEILKEHYGIPGSKITVIPHGVHNVPPGNNPSEKGKLGYGNRVLLASFGFLRPGRGARSSGRGYEYVIEAMPDIVKKFPNALYLIIGVTHPKTVKREGEMYRNSLEEKVRDLGLEEHVKFINEYVSLDELFTYLKATDIYVCSSLNPQQVTSGTLAYAMGCGCAVVSTPFFHAREAITPDRGILLDDFKDPGLFSKAIIKILSNPSLRKEMKKNAYEYMRGMTWSRTAESYMKVFNKHAKAF